MTLTITLDELLDWTAEERVKWLTWLRANVKALDVAVQPGGRFSTVATLIDHIFLVEQRHTLRLQRRPLPTESGVAAGHIDELFAYATRGREALRDYLPTLDGVDALTPREVVVATGAYALSPRKLLFHMALHEVRHWAQIAAAVRVAGFTPPGDHDLFFSQAMV